VNKVKLADISLSQMTKAALNSYALKINLARSSVHGCHDFKISIYTAEPFGCARFKDAYCRPRVHVITKRPVAIKINYYNIYIMHCTSGTIKPGLKGGGYGPYPQRISNNSGPLQEPNKLYLHCFCTKSCTV